MPEKQIYQSQRIGPSFGTSLQFNVFQWDFTGTPSSAVDIFRDTTRPRLIIGMKLILNGPSSASLKQCTVRAKKINSTPSIAEPGIDLMRWFTPSGVSIENAAVNQFPGYFNVWVTTDSVQIYMRERVYLDETMELNIGIGNFANPTLQISFLTGDPKELLPLL